MKNILLLQILLLIPFFSFSQKDIIVMDSGKRIECKIISVDDSLIHFNYLSKNSKWVKIQVETQKVKKYIYYKYRYSLENLENSSPEDLDHYLHLAKNKKTAGLIISGIAIITITSAIFFIEDDSEPLGPPVQFVVGAGGILIGAIGLPLLIKGSKREKRIKNIKASRSNTGKVEIIPNGLYYSYSQNFYPGITVKISF